MDDQEYQEIKRRWDNKHSEINKLIAYCEELREDLDTKFIPSGIARNKLDNMRAILQTHYQVRIEEPDAFAVDRIRELEEENAKLKGLVFALRGHMEISSWTNKEQRLAQMNLELEEENAKLSDANRILKEEVEEEREVKFSVMKTCKQYREVNAKLKAELRIERIER
jgi:hypothetical protein